MARRDRLNRVCRFAAIAGLVFALVCFGHRSAADARPDLSGAVRSGAQRLPISGSAVTLYAAGTRYGAGAARIAKTTSGKDGGFALAAFTCPAGNPETYITAVGGASRFGTNPAVGLMAVLGPCESLSNSAIVISELTTVAGEWALAQFSDSTGERIGAPRSAALAFTNAVKLAMANLGEVSTGGSATFLARISSSCSGEEPTPNCDALEKLDTLGNIIGACVNSVGPSSGACTTLFTRTHTAVTGTTLAAAHAIAANPGNNVDTLFAIQNGSSVAPFTPVRSAAPNDWTLGLNYTGGGLNGPQAIAIDASGNAWIANYEGSSVTELSSLGTPISPASGYKGGGILRPQAIATDREGNVWIANDGSRSVARLNSSGLPLSPAAGFAAGGLDSPFGLAIDSANDIWVASHGSNTVAKLNSDGSPVSPPTGFNGGGLNLPQAIAIDSAGDVWVANAGNSSVTKLNSGGSPLSPATGFTGGGLSTPSGVAVDSSGNVWVSNAGNDSVTELDSRGAPLSPKTGFIVGHPYSPRGVAIDSSGNVWVANAGSSVSELDRYGTPVSPPSGYRAGGLLAPQGIAIDSSGNVWVANFDNDSVTELVGVASPVTTPLAPGGPVRP